MMLKRLLATARAALKTRAAARNGPLSEAARRESDKRIVQRLATSNVRLQRGEYATQRDLDRERVKSYGEA